MRFEAYFDGGKRSKGNSGPAACGAILLREGSEIRRDRRFIGIATSNDAEWQGLLLALRIAKEVVLSTDELTIYGDSKLVVNQVLGKWRAKDPKMAAYRDRAWEVGEKIGCRLRISHVLREGNEECDQYVRKFLTEYILTYR
jgi:ribonuclease HI